MPCKNLPPYPTHVEIIRIITTAFDIKNTNKTLDDKALETNVDYRLIDELINQSIHDPIQKYTSPDIAKIIVENVEHLFSDYVQLIRNMPADGIARDKMRPMLLQYFFYKYAGNLLIDIYKKLGGPDPGVLTTDSKCSVTVVLDWLIANEGGWPGFLHGINKEQQDRISAWHRRADIPSSQYIYLLQDWSNGPYPENINWPRVRGLLLIARAIDFSDRYAENHQFTKTIRLGLRGTNADSDMHTNIRRAQEQFKAGISDVLPIIADIQQGLRITTPKAESDKDQLYSKIQNVRKYLNDRDKNKTTEYWLDWHEARWNALAGNIKKSRKLYKIAFEGCLFRAGFVQEQIINEALVIASSILPPDKVFLKHLKNASVVFKYDLPSAKGESKSFKASDIVENWEITLWQSQFKTIFPKGGLFTETKYVHEVPRMGPLHTVDIESIKPDYRYPNRTIKVGSTWKKSIPQLVWFSQIEKVNIVEKLLKNGANVNVFSDSGDSPLLMALGALDVTSIPCQSLDDRLFRLFIKHKHTSETLNRRTDKRRLLPIISAVETGRPDIVKLLLDMGSDPNGRGQTDEQTAFNVCLKYIGMIKDPQKFWKNQDAMQLTPEVLDSHRRYSNGLSGHTLDQQKHSIMNMRNDSAFNKLMSYTKSEMTKNIKANMKLHNLREIAKLLLKFGADPNIEYASPVPGYTSMMLSAELDEIVLFEIMLIKGGNPLKYYIDPRTNRKINCWDIAKDFQSKSVSNCLEDIKMHFIK